MSGPAFLKIDDVAARWNVSIRTVRALVASGELRAVRIGPRTVRVPMDAVAEAEKPYTGDRFGGEAA